MINFTTNKPYQGANIDKLSGLGSEFCTFKQAVNYWNLTGKELKGAKGCAKLTKIVVKQQKNKKTKKMEQKKVPKHFVVFEKSHLQKIIFENTKQKVA